MRRVARLLPILLSVLLTSAPLSASACDLSCWLQRSGPDCHQIGSSSVDSHTAMSEASEMHMSSGSEAGLANAQANGRPSHAVSATTHHSMSTQMNMRRGSGQPMEKAYGSSSARLDRSNALSLCVHGTCAQAATSSSPPSAGHSQIADLQFLAVHALNFAKPLTASGVAAPETSRTVSQPLELLSTFRI
jgi:hypothetical protein